MSVWGDILDRGAGEKIRKEDEYQNVLDGVNPSEPLIYIGNIDQSTIPSFPLAGQIFYTNDVVTINGIEYPSGCMVLYDGTNWINVGDFVHQRVDANIGYYQPVDVQESSII